MLDSSTRAHAPARVIIRVIRVPGHALLTPISIIRHCIVIVICTCSGGCGGGGMGRGGGGSGGGGGGGGGGGDQKHNLSVEMV